MQEELHTAVGEEASTKDKIRELEAQREVLYRKNLPAAEGGAAAAPKAQDGSELRALFGHLVGALRPMADGLGEDVKKAFQEVEAALAKAAPPHDPEVLLSAEDAAEPQGDRRRRDLLGGNGWVGFGGFRPPGCCGPGGARDPVQYLGVR